MGNSGAIGKPRLPSVQPHGAARGRWGGESQSGQERFQGTQESENECGVGGSESEHGWKYEEGVAGQRLANREDPWAADNQGERLGRREQTEGVQKGQAAARAAPTAAVVPARLRSSPLCAPPPLPPSLPPSLLPSPPRLGAAASRAGSPVRSALAQALLLTGRRTPTPRPGPVHLLLQLLQSHFQALSPQDPSGWGREGEGREKARNEARACALAVASLRPEVPCPAHLARRRHFPGLVFPEGRYPWSFCCGEFDHRCR